MERLNEETRPLAEEAVRRAEAIASRYARIFPEYESDFVSAANYGAVRAAATYVPKLGGVWRRWSSVCIRGEIKDFLDNSYLKHRRTLTDKLLDAYFDDRSDMEIARSDAKLSFDRIIAMLPTKHKELCLLVYKEGMTAAEAGISMGYTPNHGDKLHREAIGILKERLAA